MYNKLTKKEKNHLAYCALPYKKYNKLLPCYLKNTKVSELYERYNPLETVPIIIGLYDNTTNTMHNYIDFISLV